MNGIRRSETPDVRLFLYLTVVLSVAAPPSRQQQNKKGGETRKKKKMDSAASGQRQRGCYSARMLQRCESSPAGRESRLQKRATIS